MFPPGFGLQAREQVYSQLWPAYVLASMKVKFLKATLPWVITAIALYIAFRAVEWDTLISHLKGANLGSIAICFSLTFLSYFLRTIRWRYLFQENRMSFLKAWQVLVLGFFMNNILPARAGELVRAHLGSKASGQSRTLVLATVASERLADGLTLSAMFLIVAIFTSHSVLPPELLYVAYLFGGVALCVGLTLCFRHKIYSGITRATQFLRPHTASYINSRIQIFIDGLAPLYSMRRLPIIVFWSLVIWMLELRVFMAAGEAFGVDLSFSYAIFFLVASNFSSLIPAAPGGLGVIEAITSALLVSLGIDRELALAMVLTQHATQYIVIGVTGALIMLQWRGTPLTPPVEVESTS
jgi:uncharacterized protein (TIRG00374 family)